MLSACGGGSSSNSGSTASTSSLSDAQKNYESSALTSNGGLHYVDGSLSLSANSAGRLSVGWSSTFFTIDSSIAQSPSTGTQSLIAGTASLSSALKLPTLTNGRQIVNGAVYVGAVPARRRGSATWDPTCRKTIWRRTVVP
ncbi:hypothetical protein OKW41_007236 [Paraburkholderia sp. UCT70]